MSEFNQYRFIKTDYGMRLAFVQRDPETGTKTINLVPGNDYLDSDGILKEINLATSKPIIIWTERLPETPTPTSEEVCIKKI